MLRENGSEFSENQHVLAFLLVDITERKREWRECREETAQTLTPNVRLREKPTKKKKPKIS